MAGPVSGADVSRATLLPGWQMDNGNRMIGVRIDLDPGWKTYWRAPGGNGIPPSFDFSGSRNIRATRVLWPEPEVFETQGIRSIGYVSSVVFPVEITPRHDGPITIDLGLFYGVCEVVCIPVQDTLSLKVDPTTKGYEESIRTSLSKQAHKGHQAGISSRTCDIRPGSDGFDLTANLQFLGPVARPSTVVIESGSEDIFVTPTATRVSGQTLTIDANLQYWGDGAMALDRSALRLTLLGDGRAIEVNGCPSG